MGDQSEIESGWPCRGSRHRVQRLPTIQNTGSGSTNNRYDSNGRPHSTYLLPGIVGGRLSIVANPESRDFIGQAVQDLILKQKTVDQACADADKGLDALIAHK